MSLNDDRESKRREREREEREKEILRLERQIEREREREKEREKERERENEKERKRELKLKEERAKDREREKEQAQREREIEKIQLKRDKVEKVAAISLSRAVQLNPRYIIDCIKSAYSGIGISPEFQLNYSPKEKDEILEHLDIRFTIDADKNLTREKDLIPKEGREPNLEDIDFARDAALPPSKWRRYDSKKISLDINNKKNEIIGLLNKISIIKQLDTNLFGSDIEAYFESELKNISDLESRFEKWKKEYAEYWQNEYSQYIQAKDKKQSDIQPQGKEEIAIPSVTKAKPETAKRTWKYFGIASIIFGISIILVIILIGILGFNDGKHTILSNCLFIFFAVSGLADIIVFIVAIIKSIANLIK